MRWSALLLLVAIACASASPNADTKLDPALRMALDEGTGSLSVLIQSSDTRSTIAAVNAAGGSATARAQTVIATVPRQAIRSITARAEVTKVSLALTDQPR